ncbi:hypothetical protein KIPB_012880 [Kipferlia bialata]|uniref:Uncharacterized protein n=1 Tax=Kipferlia bialata TaxID=797122 RepID=A0A9K3D7R9_9EUKA|nr:hypothetical protein KIPB_012880 [Kipferlia bialata]|eukprot:g12880.t1
MALLGCKVLGVILPLLLVSGCLCITIEVSEVPVYSDHSGSFTLTNEEYVDNMTKGWLINPSPVQMRYAIVYKEGTTDPRDILTAYKAHCTADSVTDLVVAGVSA